MAIKAAEEKRAMEEKRKKEMEAALQRDIDARQK
jgi:hypothetical protein